MERIFNQILRGKKKLLLYFFLLLFCSFSSVYSSESEFLISVDAILPENQKTSGVNYFDLKMEASEEQKVIIKLTNHSSEEVKLKVIYSEAKTTSQGVIEYSENNSLKTYSPPELLFPNVINGPEKIKISAKETKEVEFMIRMPEKKYDGFIAGGVEFVQGIEKAEDKGSLHTQRSYLVGFRISETDESLPIDLDLNQTTVGIQNYKNAILIPVVNKNGNYVEELSIHGTVMKKNSKQVVLETKLEQGRMAPYSIMETPIYLDETLLDEGEYELKLVTKARGDYQKEWNQAFKVTKKDVELFKSNQDLWNDNHENAFFMTILVVMISIFIAVPSVILVIINKDKVQKKLKDKRIKIKK